MKKFLALILAGSIALSSPVFASEDYSQAINKVKSIFNIPDMENFNISSFDDNVNMEWSNEDGDYIYTSLEDGVITSYTTYSDYKDTDRLQDNFSQKELREKSQYMLREILGEEVKNWKFVDYEDSVYDYVTFEYQKYLGDYPINNNTIYFVFSKATGECTSYNMNYLNETKNIVNAEEIISKADAKAIYLKNAMFRLWYDNPDSKPVYQYIAPDSYDLTWDEYIPCVDAVTGEFFYGLGYVGILDSASSNSAYSEAKADKKSSFENADEFITVQEAVNVLNSKMGTNLLADDFTASYSMDSSGVKEAYFENNDNNLTSFSIDENNKILYYAKYAISFDNKGGDYSKQAEKILQKNGYSLPEFVAFKNAYGSTTYYQKKNGIPSNSSTITIEFDENGQLIQYFDYTDNKAYTKVNTAISPEDAFDIADKVCNFAPVYIPDSQDIGKLRLAYCFKIYPNVDYAGNLLNSFGDKYYTDDDTYTDITGSDRDIVLYLSKMGFNFSDMTSFQPEKSVTIEDFMAYQGNLSYDDINKSLGTKYTEADKETLLTKAEFLKIILYDNFGGDLSVIKNAFKNSQIDPYTNTALSLGIIDQSTGTDDSISRIEMAKILYKLYKL